jgi:hypothetical protein
MRKPLNTGTRLARILVFMRLAGGLSVGALGKVSPYLLLMQVWCLPMSGRQSSVVTYGAWKAAKPPCKPCSWIAPPVPLSRLKASRRCSGTAPALASHGVCNEPGNCVGWSSREGYPGMFDVQLQTVARVGKICGLGSPATPALMLLRVPSNNASPWSQTG